MGKKIFSLFLASLLLISLVAGISGCKETPADYSGEDSGITFTLDKTEFSVNTLNLPLTNQEIAIFDRFYTIDGEATAFVDGDHTGRTLVTVRYNPSYKEFTILAIDNSEGEKANTLIPVNGFVVSIPSAMLEGLRVRESQVVTVIGYDTEKCERMDLASFIPKESALARRIYYVNPTEIPTEELIYFVSEEFGKDITLGNGVIAAKLEKENSNSYSVSQFLTEGTLSAGTCAIVFNGKYNCEYAQTVLKEGAFVMLSDLDSANSVCHEAAIKLNDTVYKIGGEHTNVSLEKDGVYLYDSAYSAGATPKSEKDFIAIAVKDGVVVYTGEKNERLVIPTNAGYVLVFCGDSISLAENYTMGDSVEEMLIFPENTPEKFVKINNYCYSFENIDHFEKDVPVLFTSNFGDTTGTSGNVVEISIKDGKVVSVTTSVGNTEIPENGYVLCFPAKGVNLANSKTVNAGDTARVALDKCEYTLEALDISAFNDVRYTDFLVIYDKSNTRTGTNQYGFEIGVNADGEMISCSNLGNMMVPDGGFVISGHGVMHDAISANYIYGGSVKLLRDEKKVVFYSTPLSMQTDVTAALNNVKEKYSQAEHALYDIDYQSISAKLDACKTLIDSVESSAKDGDPVNAINALYEITLQLADLEEAMITEKAVEERSVWYRSNVKSDEDVLAVIEKCVKYNINAIYVETWYNGKTIGSTKNPLIQHYTAQHGDYDALEGFVRIAHEHGIQIHAWVENFFIGTTSQMSGDPDHVGHHNEDWILLDKDGKNYFISPEYGNFVFLNPQNRECRDLVLEVYRELLENYDIDGIHLDYIRYPEHNGNADFGYNEDTIKAFQKEYGYTTDPHNYKAGSKEYKDWIAFRQNVITTFVKEVNDLVKEVRPEVWITAACYPSLTDAPNQIYQYTTEWVKLGYIDQVFSMTYSNGTEYVKNNAESFIKACKDKALYSTGLTLFSGNSGEELLSQIKGVREVGATGQAFFSLSSLLGFEEYENVIINHAYRTKAVSLFDVDGAVLAYANDLLEKCDGVYSQRTEGQEEVIAKVKTLLTEIKTEAEKQEYNTVEEQKALLAYVTERTEAILAEAENAGSDLKNALNREAGEMHYNLSVLYTRMEAKTSK